MTVQTQFGAPMLDAEDYQVTTHGVTWGLEVRYVPTPDGEFALSVLVVEKINGEWKFATSLASDGMGELERLGVAAFVGILVLALNAWLKKRFAGTVDPVPPVDFVPQIVRDLDLALGKLKAFDDGGVPQVKV